MATITTNSFVELIRKSQLLSEQTLNDFLKRVGSQIETIDPNALAAMLVKNRILTKFQATQLLSGKHKGYFLGPYKILEPIGQGGMATVYLAEHSSLNRRAAVKLISSIASKPDTIERFLREARSNAKLDHPNIVKVYDVGETDNVHYIAMEYIEGKTLEKMVSEHGPMNVSQAVQYIAQAALGLAHTHEKGLVHRDVTPSNLIRDKNSGLVKVLDLGLTREFANEDDDVTRRYDGQYAVTGTADYMSPEQAAGESQDFRTDIYSLGATLYKILAGKGPFKGSNTQKLIAHQLHSVPPLSSVRGDIPAELDAVLDKMMAKSPTQRYQSMAEVIIALDPWLEPGWDQEFSKVSTIIRKGTTTKHFVPQVEKQTPTNESVRQSKPPVFWYVFSAVVVTLLVAIGAVFFLTRDQGTDPKVVERAPGQTSAAPTTTKTISSPAKTVQPVTQPSTTPVEQPNRMPIQEVLAPLHGRKPLLNVNLRQTPTQGYLFDDPAIKGSKVFRNLPAALQVNPYFLKESGFQMEASVRDLNNERVLSFRQEKGHYGSQILVRLSESLPTKASGWYVARLIYSADGAGTAYAGVQSLKAPYTRLTRQLLGNSNNQWRVIDIPFAPSGTNEWSFLMETGEKTGTVTPFTGWMNFHSLQIWDQKNLPPLGTPRMNSKPLYSTTFKDFPNQMVRVDKRLSLSQIDGKPLPKTWVMNTYQDNTKVSFAARTFGNFQAIGYEWTGGSTPPQLKTKCNDVLENLPPTAQIVVRLTYQASNDTYPVRLNSMVRGAKNFFPFQTYLLPESTNQWKTEDFIFQRGEDGEFSLVISHLSGTEPIQAAQPWVWIRSMDVYLVEE
ncbi:MAG: serine/threonine-protein kinase [Zavarzinella sp.]